MSAKEKITGAEALMRALIDEGVDHVFGYPGGSIMPVYNALYDHPDRIKHILTRHEQGAIHAAQGYARVSGKPGVVFTTSGPGATNLVTGIADALIDSTPLVIVTGQVDSGLLGFDAFQETDVVGVTLAVSKWSCQIRKAEDVAQAVARAFYIASSGRPGPVILDFTQDAQNALTDFDYNKCDFIRSYSPHPTIDDTLLAQAAELINSSQRPMIISGRGVMISGAEDSLRQLAEKIDAPLSATLLGLSTVESSNPLYKGMVGMHGNIGPNINTNRADLIIAIGMRFDNRVTGNPRTYAKNAKIIHIDIDESEFDKNVHADISLLADAKEAIEALIPLVNNAKHTEWLESFDRLYQYEDANVIQQEINPQTGTINMGEVITKVTDATGGDAIVVTDVGLNQMMAARYARYTKSKSMVTSGGLGTMGFGLPAAIGAKMAAPDRTVVLYVGDGGLQMTIQELGTILENGTDIKIVLLNNNFLGNVRQLQTVQYGGRYSATPLVNPDFVAIAKAYGLGAEEVKDRTELDGAIKRMLDAKGAYLLNVNIGETYMVFPMTKAGDHVDNIYIALNKLMDKDAII